MSDSEYCKMLEIPSNTCDVIVKGAKKKKDVKQKVIERANIEAEKSEGEFTTTVLNSEPQKKTKRTSKKAEKRRTTESEGETVAVENSSFDIVSVQVVAIFVLVVGILLTNIFWEDSGMNNLFRSVFMKNSLESASVYTSFEASAPSKIGSVNLTDGVMSVSGSVYSPCDGVVKNIEKTGENYSLTISHSSSFETVVEGLDFAYVGVGDKVTDGIPVGFSEGEATMKMFDRGTLLTSYSIVDGNIIWEA